MVKVVNRQMRRGKRQVGDRETGWGWPLTERCMGAGSNSLLTPLLDFGIWPVNVEQYRRNLKKGIHFCEHDAQMFKIGPPVRPCIWAWRMNQKKQVHTVIKWVLAQPPTLSDRKQCIMRTGGASSCQSSICFRLLGVHCSKMSSSDVNRWLAGVC